jgi:uncharacterized membrane protein YbhN (UPF0104 family)
VNSEEVLRLRRFYAIIHLKVGDYMKAIRIFLWIIICIIFSLGLLYLFTGSLEWFPTPEQQEKAHITAFIMMVIPAISGILLFLTRKK